MEKNVTVRENEFLVKAIWADEVDKKVKDDFIFVQNDVYGGEMTEFDLKYHQNIYGKSLILITYAKDGDPAATQVFWRHDVNGFKAYQSCDSAVRTKYRRNGLFRLMVEWGVEIITADNDCHVYGYPNDNSDPQFEKMGWKVLHKLYYHLFCGNGSYKKFNSKAIPEDYALWWFVGNTEKQPKVYRCGKHSYLVREREGHKHIFTLIGEVSENVAQHFEAVKGINIFFYKSAKPGAISKYIKITNVIVSCEKFLDIGELPLFYVDAI